MFLLCTQGTSCIKPKGDHLGQVHSDQTVLEMIRQGRLSGRAIAQQRSRVSKLGIKGLSDYHSNETTVKAAKREASGPNKTATLTKHLLLKRESWTTALSLIK
jgi:hypothetical protein